MGCAFGVFSVFEAFKQLLVETTLMPTRRRQRFITSVCAWMIGTVLTLSQLGALSLELFFVVSLIGFLIAVELTAPFSVTPAWRKRLKWIIGAGLLVFGYIVIRRILAILPPGVL